MKIISPVDKPEEARVLLDAGADELYGGYLPEAWGRTYRLEASINQRTFAAAQLDSRQALQQVVAATHEHGGRFSLTLNAPFYTEAQVPLVLDCVAEAAAAGVDGVIVADLGVLRQVRRRFPDLELQVSTLAHPGNSAAVEFYRRQGCERVILPRHVPLDEMAAIIAAVPKVRFDAFLLVGKCPNTEGLCTFHHASPDRVWPCEIPYRISPLQEPAPEALKRAMARQGSWARTDRRHGCGLCALPRLGRMGIQGVKLVGRGAPALQKARNVQLVREFLELAAAETDPEVYRRQARAAHRRRFGAACSANVCYYPELFQEE